MTGIQIALLGMLLTLDVIVLRLMHRRRERRQIRSAWNTKDPLVWRRRRREGTLPPLDAVLPRIQTEPEPASVETPDGTVLEYAPEAAATVPVAAEPTVTEPLASATRHERDSFDDDPYVVPASWIPSVTRSSVSTQVEGPTESSPTVKPVPDPAPGTLLVRDDAELMSQVLHGPDRVQRRARALFMLGNATPVESVAEQLGVHPSTVRRWRREYHEAHDDAMSASRS